MTDQELIAAQSALIEQQRKVIEELTKAVGLAHRPSPFVMPSTSPSVPWHESWPPIVTCGSQGMKIDDLHGVNS